MEQWKSVIVVDRAVEDVFAFVMDPKNGPLWHAGLDELRPISEDPIAPGKQYRNMKQILLWTLETITEVTEYEPYSKVSFKSRSGLFIFELRYRFERVEKGTRLTEIGTAQMNGIMKLAARLAIGTSRKNSEIGLGKLKHILETQAR